MRAAIFIDGGYLLQQMKIARVTPDYPRLADYFLAPIRSQVPLDLLRCYFYYAPPWMPQNPSEDDVRRMETHRKFVEEIESLSRWQTRMGKLERRFDGPKEYFEQKRVDVLLSVDMTRHAAAGHIQHAVLVAGDSDFIPAVEAAKESGVTLTLWCGAFNTVHKDLVMLADDMHQFDRATFPHIKEGKNGEAGGGEVRLPPKPSRPAAARPAIVPAPAPAIARTADDQSGPVLKKARSRRRR